MKCILMNKNTPVIEVEIDEDTAIISKVIQTYELDFLPIGISVSKGSPNKKELNMWWLGRSIPASRSGIRTALEKLDIQYTEQLLLKCYGLSLSDQYWMKPVNSELEWTNINFFENNFSDDVGNVLFGQPASKDIDLMSPCNTSDGWLKKKWKIIDGKRYLLKAGSNPFLQEPINEVFGTRLHQRLGYSNYVSYSIWYDGGQPYSLCENFIDTNTELVNAVSINRSRKKENHVSSYEHFMRTCNSMGISGMKEYMDYLLVFDYLMANTDRHFGNFGVIRNVETLEWQGPAPIFDSGTSLWHDKLTKAIQPFSKIEMKPFYSDEERQLELVSDFSWISFEELTNLKDDFREIFLPSDFIEEERIEALIKAVSSRVEVLKNMQRERKRVF